MSSFQQRAARVATLASERGLDLLLVTNLVNVRYLCGFTGTNGLCLIGSDANVFVTDFRYVERARTEVPDFELVKGKRDLLGDVAELVKARAGNTLKLGFDEAHLTVKTHARLAELLEGAGELVPAAGLVEGLRARKDEGELASIRAVTEIADEVYRWLIDVHGLVGHSEVAVARALTRRAEDAGADAVSFPPIVAAGANGALPHAMPGEAEIETGSLVVVDFGCQLDGYCSDCTRTFATGEVDAEAREAYELVRSAQAAAVEAVAVGAEFSAVDDAARERIAGAGRGEQFGHGVGHGVGLEVHEAPRLAPDAEGRLEAGNVVTVEPGVYVPARFGVRIEDLVVVSTDGPEVLTSVPKDLISI
jgi:Xaa-Pro aminopeptidase